MSNSITNPTFSQVHQTFRPSTTFGIETGGDQHLRAEPLLLPNGSQATGLYLHSGISRLGHDAMQERMTKWAAGAEFVRQTIDREYGRGVGDLVFTKIHEDGGPDLSTGVRRGDLKTIQAKIDEMGDNGPLLQKFGDRGLNDVESANAHVANMFTAVQKMSDEDTKRINQALLGGGNYALLTLYSQPGILNIEDDETRKQAFQDEFDSITVPARDLMIRQIDEHALDPGHQYFGLSSDMLDVMKMGSARAFEVDKEKVPSFLENPDNLEMTKGFVQLTKGLGLGFDDAMAVVRSRQNIQSVGLDEVQAAVDKVFAGAILTDRERGMVDILFPLKSS